MRSLYSRFVLYPFLALLLVPGFLRPAEDDSPEREIELWHLRNLGKAFYENPTTATQAVETFARALELAPDSARERLNYGLALLRTTRIDEGVEELKQAQRQAPELPHTWFNLGMTYKKQARYDLATEQLERMVELAPEEPISRYNLGVLYKLSGENQKALEQFLSATRLDPNLAGPHFQLYNAYRSLGNEEAAARELALFQGIKRLQTGAAIPEDLEWSYYSEIYDEVEPLLPPGPSVEDVEPDFQTVYTGIRLEGEQPGMLLLDYNGDGATDLLVWSSRSLYVLDRGTADARAFPPLPETGAITAAAGDFDNDGASDLCVVRPGRADILRSRDGVYEPVAAPIPPGNYAAALWLDYDHDYDLDLFLFGEQSVLLRNNGAAGFSDQTADFPFQQGNALSAVAVDWIKDTNGMDLVVLYGDRDPVLYRDRLSARFEPLPLPGFPRSADQLLAADLDNDGWTDLVTSHGSEVIFWLNRAGRLERLPAPAPGGEPIVLLDLENRGIPDLMAGGRVFAAEGLGRVEERHPAVESATWAAVLAADLDADGRVDLAVIDEDGEVRILRNATETPFHWIGLHLEGVRNLIQAPWAEIEVKAGPLYQKQLYRGFPLVFGLGPYQEADAVRITWPNGLIQNEIKQPADRFHEVQEKQRLSGSCPMIFTWNGSEFEFITDVLGVAPLGASAGNGDYFPVDHDEYIQIPADSLAVRDGFYEIRITEELREVAYLDQIRLLALDHPETVDVFTNEKFKGPPFPEFRLFATATGERVYPIRAVDGKGNDLLARVTERDAAYADTFSRSFSGTAELHALELDFGSGTAPDNQALLVLNGWVDWADGSTFLQVSQEGSGLVMPYLQVRDEQGDWVTVIEDMGVPAGKPKTIVVDLSGRFLSPERQVRIVTSLCVYWDEIFLSEDRAAPLEPLHPVSLAEAELQFRGFSTPVIHPLRLQPERFDYSRWMPVSMWNPTPGLYTRYGPVEELIRRIDDRFVIMGSGDELRLRFRAAELGPVERGKRRSFFLHVDGWAKDGDLNTAYSQSVEPLPFHAMSRYPYAEGESYPDSLHRSYRRDYLTRPALRLLQPLGGSP